MTLRRPITTVLAVLLLLTCALSGSTASAASANRTKLVVRVAGCPTCKVNLTRAFSGTSTYWRGKAELVGSDHQVVFHPLTSRTRGLSFEVSAPWESPAAERQLNVVTRYSGQSAGETWSVKKAKAAKRAYGCWAGTKRASVTLHFRIASFTFDGSDYGYSTKETGAVAWATPGMRSLRPRVHTWHGSIGNQEIFYCS